MGENITFHSPLAPSPCFLMLSPARLRSFAHVGVKLAQHERQAAEADAPAFTNSSVCRAARHRLNITHGMWMGALVSQPVSAPMQPPRSWVLVAAACRANDMLFTSPKCLATWVQGSAAVRTTNVSEHEAHFPQLLLQLSSPRFSRFWAIM